LQVEISLQSGGLRVSGVVTEHHQFNINGSHSTTISYVINGVTRNYHPFLSPAGLQLGDRVHLICDRANADIASLDDAGFVFIPGIFVTLFALLFGLFALVHFFSIMRPAKPSVLTSPLHRP
jgi:uncharacterized membrane protein YfhO